MTSPTVPLTLRMDPELRRRLVAHTARCGRSLNWTANHLLDVALRGYEPPVAPAGSAAAPPAACDG